MSNHETVRPDPGIVLEFAAAVMQQLPRDLPPNVMEGWIKNKKALGMTLREALMSPAARESSAASLTESSLFDQLIQTGSYRKMDRWISGKNAPAYTRPVGAVVEYLDLGELSLLRDNLQKMIVLGYRPAEDLEVLDHDIRNPIQLEMGHPVVVLGSSWRLHGGNRCVLILSRVDAERRVGLYWRNGGWCSPYRFAAVKLSS